MGADEKAAQRKRREFEEKWGRGEAGPDDANYDKDRDYLSEFEQGMILGTAKDAIERLAPCKTSAPTKSTSPSAPPSTGKASKPSWKKSSRRSN